MLICKERQLHEDYEVKKFQKMASVFPRILLTDNEEHYYMQRPASSSPISEDVICKDMRIDPTNASILVRTGN